MKKGMRKRECTFCVYVEFKCLKLLKVYFVSRGALCLVRKETDQVAKLSCWVVGVLFFLI